MTVTTSLRCARPRLRSTGGGPECPSSTEHGRPQVWPTCEGHLGWMTFGLVDPTVQAVRMSSAELTPTTTGPPPLAPGTETTQGEAKPTAPIGGCDELAVARIIGGDQRVWAVRAKTTWWRWSATGPQSTRPSLSTRRPFPATGSGNCCI